jgi:hypothetical protein
MCTMPRQRVSHGVKREEYPLTVCEGRGMVTFQQIKQGVCQSHYGLAIYIKK